MIRGDVEDARARLTQRVCASFADMIERLNSIEPRSGFGLKASTAKTRSGGELLKFHSDPCSADEHAAYSHAVPSLSDPGPPGMISLIVATWICWS